MKNKGYTLLELLGVIVILSVLVTLVFPSVINFIKKGNDKIDSITNDLIISAASDYAKDNSSELYLLDGGTHCVSIETLIGKNYLDESLIEEDLYTSKSVKITNIDKFKYEITDTATCMVLPPGLYDEHDRLLFSWDELNRKTIEETEISFENLLNRVIVQEYTDEYGTIQTRNRYATDIIDSIDGAHKLILDESVAKIGNEAFVGSKNLKEVIIEGKTEIGDDAFNDSNLEKITMNEVTSIGARAFWGTSLENVTIPESVTRVGDSAFIICQNLKTVTIKANLTSIEPHTFYDCINLTNVNIPDSVTYIGHDSFSGTAITNIEIPNSVETIEYNAFGRSSLTNLTIPSSVKNVETAAFSDCQNLKTVTIEEGIIGIEDRVFMGCKNLTNINIPNSATYIGESAFDGCTSLTEITVPDNVIKIREYAFFGCKNLTNLTIGKGIKGIGEYAFQGTINLSTIKVDSNNQVYDSRDNCNAIIETATNKLIVGSNNTIIPGTVEIIGDRAFVGHKNITQITIPSSVKSIETLALAATGLSTITIPKSVIDIHVSAFEECDSLTTIYYKGKQTEAPWGYQYAWGAPKATVIYE